MPTAIAGKSLIAFGAAALAGSLIGAVLLDALVFDLGAVVVILLGLSVAGGNLRSVRWSIAAMLYYPVVAALLLLAGYLRADSLRVAGHAVSPTAMRLLAPIISGFAIWAFVNLVLLKRALRLAGRNIPETE